MQYLFLLLASLFFLLRTYDSAPSEFTAYDIVSIAIFSGLGLAVQLLAAFALRRRPVFQYLALGFFLVVNVFLLHILLSAAFVSMGNVALVAMGLAGAFIAITIFRIFHENPRVNVVANAVMTIACASSLAVTIIQQRSDILPSPKPGRSGTSNIQLVDFKSKPNVYFVGFDSLAPRTLVKAHMEVDGVAYHDVVERKFRGFRNAFADAVPTKASLNSLLSLDHQYFIELSVERKQYDLFVGNAPSPMIEIFRHNGYTTNTFFNSRYFGPAKGPHVDNYWVNSRFGACEFLDKQFKKFVFFGYCAAYQKKWFLSIAGLREAEAKSDALEFLLSGISNGLETGKPQLWVGHIYMPGHTEHSFAWGDEKAFKAFRKFYTERSEIAAQYLEKLTDFLAREDPDSILIIFGDHGPWLSRKFPRTKNLEFFIKDRYGVYSGVYPPDRCERWFPQESKREYITTIKVARGIIRCLADGQSPNIKEDEFRPMIIRLPAKGKPLYRHGKLRYERFLYE